MKALSTILFIASIVAICGCKEKYASPIIDPGPEPVIDTFLLIPGTYTGSVSSFDQASGGGPNYDSSGTISTMLIVTSITQDSIHLRYDTTTLQLKRYHDTASYYGFVSSPVEYNKVYIKADSIFLDEHHFDFRGNNTWRRNWGSTGRWKKMK